LNFRATNLCKQGGHRFDPGHVHQFPLSIS
jgi:hypothetical protein